MKTFIGIADAHGIESFMDKDKQTASTLTGLMFRAQSNRQRHALVYQIDLNKKQEKQIDKLIHDQAFEEALVLLKTFPELMVENSMHRSINMIPNKEIDPYYVEAQ